MRIIFKGFSRDIYSSVWQENTSALLDCSRVDVPPDGCARGLRPQSSEGSSVSSESWTRAISGQETERSLPDSHRKERKLKINGGNVGGARVLRKMTPTLEISPKFTMGFLKAMLTILLSPRKGHLLLQGCTDQL